MRNQRLFIFYGVLIVGLLFLLARLFELQIIFGQQNRGLAEGNRIKKEILPAPRGMIYDKNGQELVRNVPVYRVKKEDGQYEVILREEALRMEARGQTENLRMDIGRDYLYGEVLAHLLGYLGEVNASEVESGLFKLGDLVGRGGLEQEYDSLLKGQDGGEIYEVDAQGEKIREIGRTEPVPGKDLHLSIDAQLSQVAYQALSGQTGAVVATDPQTGQVLVLVSSPSFDPNLLGQSKDLPQEKLLSQQVQIEALFNDPGQPFFNRAVGGVYPPGSTFKIVTAVAGLEEGKIDSQTTWEDTGEIRVGEYSYKNWYFTQYGRTEGVINVVQAIKRSTDTFFYKVGEWVGPSRLAAWAKAFGLGQKTNLDLPGETAGLVPSPEGKEEKGERWFLGNTYHFAIGQGDLLTTPLQINLLTGVIANGGKLCRPFINTSGETQCQSLKLEKQTLDLVKEGMKGACSPGGTAYPFFNFSPPVGCKTGTAEYGDPQDKTHAWLTAFAPDEIDTEAQMVVTVLVEGGGEGSAVAAPIAKKVMEAFFHGGQ